MIVVERATEEDLLPLFEIDRAAGHPERAAELEEAVKTRRAYIARDQDTHLGFAVIKRDFFGYPFIALLVVHPNYRRRGVASALVAYIEKTCPADRLFTSTNLSNQPAQALFERLGFSRSGIIENLDDDDPELIYVKRLKRD
ncbi:MAG: GNAT family N-acetyltransferase [Chloroflexota bacterium]